MKERALFIQKFERIAREDPRILSAFLGGSLADGTEDDFSDIDIYYILDEQSYSDFPSQMRTHLSEMGPSIPRTAQQLRIRPDPIHLPERSQRRAWPQNHKESQNPTRWTLQG